MDSQNPSTQEPILRRRRGRPKSVLFKPVVNKPTTQEPENPENPPQQQQCQDTIRSNQSQQQQQQPLAAISSPAAPPSVPVLQHMETVPPVTPSSSQLHQQRPQRNNTKSTPSSATTPPAVVGQGQTRTRLTDEQKLILLQLCLEFQTEHVYGNKLKFWDKVRNLLFKKVGKLLKDPQQTVTALVKQLDEDYQQQKQIHSGRVRGGGGGGGVYGTDTDLAQAVRKWKEHEEELKKIEEGPLRNKRKRSIVDLDGGGGGGGDADDTSPAGDDDGDDTEDEEEEDEEEDEDEEEEQNIDIDQHVLVDSRKGKFPIKRMKMNANTHGPSGANGSSRMKIRKVLEPDILEESKIIYIVDRLAPTVTATAQAVTASSSSSSSSPSLEGLKNKIEQLEKRFEQQAKKTNDMLESILGLLQLRNTSATTSSFHS